MLVVFAQDAYPASSLYNLKRLYENITMSIQFSDEKKSEYYLSLVEKRMAELERVYAEEQYQHLLITSLRYAATTGNATEFMVSQALDEDAAQLKIMMTNYVKRFEILRSKLPEENEDGRFLTDAINYTNANIQKIQ